MTGREYEKSVKVPGSLIYTDSDIVLAFEMGKKEVLKNFHQDFISAWESVFGNHTGMDRVENELRNLLDNE